MTTKNYILFILFITGLFLLTTTVLATNQQGCCLQPYDDGNGQTYFLPVLGVYDQSTCDQNLPGSLWTDNDCYTGPASQPTGILVDNFNTGYCCDDTTNTPLAIGTGFEGIIYEPYCNALPEHTFQTTPCTTTPTETFYNVSGYVFDQNGNPLSGITVRWLDQTGNVQMETTTTDGFYKFTDVTTGQATFLALAPTGYAQTCSQSQTSQVITNTITGQNFTLTCEENQEACTPDWYTGPWGECVPYTVNGETIMVQFREVNDLNNCSTTIGQPTNINTSNCEGTVSFGDCGNGEIDGSEQCDGTNYKDPLSDKTLHTAPSCNAFGLKPDEQQIGCTNVCTYDTSACVPECGPTCDRVSECGNCTICNGNIDVCGDPCDDTKPQFLNNMQDKTTRNVFDLYTLKEQQPDQFEGQNIEYFEGTPNVKINWAFNDSCINKVLAFKVKICEESNSEGLENTCGSLPAKEFTTTNIHTKELLIPGVLEPNKKYCYNVASVNLDGTENWAYNDTDQLPCFATGDEYCLQPHDPGLNCLAEDENAQPKPKGCLSNLPGPSFGKTNLTLLDGDCLNSVTDDSLKTCIEIPFDPTNGKLGAECRLKSECSLCNGLFGLFAEHNLKSFFYTSPTDTASTKCNNFMYTPGYEVPSIDANTPVGTCYLDMADNGVQEFRSCDNVRSCYDYKTQKSCEDDSCYKFTDEENGNGCQWNKYNNELGVGVCEPKQKEEQNCFRCDTDSPIGFCNEELCGLYGDCYFKTTENHEQTESSKAEHLFNKIFPHQKYGSQETESAASFTSTCFPEEHVGCYFYNNKEDCIGNAGNESEPIINVKYVNAFATAGEKEGRIGDNKQIGFSNDKYHFGDCIWNNNTDDGQNYGCNKNSDGFYNQIGSSSATQKTGDCAFLSSTESFKNCLNDNATPSTEIILRDAVEQEQYRSNITGEYLPVYGLGEITNITYGVEDDKSPADVIATYFSFIPVNNCTGCIPFVDINISNITLDQGIIDSCYQRGCELYPQRKLEQYEQASIQDQYLHNGEQVMIYYSEDLAHNLEEVQHKNIYLDTQGPRLDGNFTYHVKSFLMGEEDVYASNLSIAFNLDEPALCYGTLYLGTKTHPIGDFKTKNTEFETFYPWLPDGYYTFEIKCYDDYNNPFIEEYNITVEGDKSITNPQPRGQVFTNISQVQLSIETPRNATCKLSDMKQPYSVSPYTFAQTTPLPNGHQQHSIAYTHPQFGASDTSGTHVYFTSCDFGNGNITEMKNGDTISFTIDKIAPTTTILASTTNRNYQPYIDEQASWSPVRYVELDCDDTNTLTPLANFGCKEIHYCIGEPLANLSSFSPSTTCVATNGQHYMQTETGNKVKLMDLRENQYGGKVLYYYSIDNGGNQEELHVVNLRLRDTVFQPPTFTWLN